MVYRILDVYEAQDNDLVSPVRPKIILSDEQKKKNKIKYKKQKQKKDDYMAGLENKIREIYE